MDTPTAQPPPERLTADGLPDSFEYFLWRSIRRPSPDGKPFTRAEHIEILDEEMKAATRYADKARNELYDLRADLAQKVETERVRLLAEVEAKLDMVRAGHDGLLDDKRQATEAEVATATQGMDAVIAELYVQHGRDLRAVRDRHLPAWTVEEIAAAVERARTPVAPA